VTDQLITVKYWLLGIEMGSNAKPTPSGRPF